MFEVKNVQYYSGIIIILYTVVFAVDYSYEKTETVPLKIKSGILQGNQKITETGKTYYNFEGIPFAEPPLGDLRFKDPVPFTKWNGSLDATKPRSNCIEIILRQITYSVIGEEDCLYLNVYTPQNPVKVRKRLPVMVWLYGGSFREGSADLYEPDYLIKDNVVVVTFNYRLGFFGFLSTGDQNAPGNYGMKDIVLALKWIKNNIDEFGGDPNKVTLFGESAGAAVIGYLMVSPLGQGLFSAAIMQSGSPLCFWALHKNPRKVAFDLGISMGITTNSSAALIKYLREVDLPNAHTSMLNVNLLNFGESIQNGGPFGPVMERHGNNAFLTKDSFKAFQKGNFLKVPILMGLNSQEAKFFTSLIPLARPLFFLYDLSPSSLVREAMKVKSSNDKREVGKKIKKFYFKSQGFITGTEEEYAEFMSDDFFVRPIIKTAQLLSKYVPVYFYVYDFEGSRGKWWVNFAAKDTKKIKGVAHATEVWYLWRTPLNNQAFKSYDEELTSRRLVRLWTNFAKFGNPTVTTDSLLENLTWPRIGGSSLDYFYIGKNLKIKRNFKEKNIAFWDSLYQNYSNGPFETY